MSLKAFVSRAFAVQSCVTVAVAYSFACNAFFGRPAIGYDVASTVLVGAILGIGVAAAIGLVDFMTMNLVRTHDVIMFNLMGVVGAVTLYNINVVAHMNTSGWTITGFVVAILLGLVCGNAYCASCAAVNKLTE